MKTPAELERAVARFDAAAKERARLDDLILNAPAGRDSAQRALAAAKDAQTKALNEATTAMVELGSDANHPTIKTIRKKLATARTDIEASEKTIAACGAIIDGSLAEDVGQAAATLLETANELHAIATPFIEALVADFYRRWSQSIVPLLAAIREGQLLAQLWAKSAHAPAMAPALQSIFLPSIADRFMPIMAAGEVNPVLGFAPEDMERSWREASELRELRDALGPVAASFSRAQDLRRAEQRRLQEEYDAARHEKLFAPPPPPPMPTYPKGTPGVSYTTHQAVPPSPGNFPPGQ